MVPRNSTFRDMEDKLISAEIAEMAWSPKMDLIAVANVKGEVILYRLSWQKVWTLEVPADGVKVSAMVWRPDGKALAIGYTDDSLIICDTEDKEILISHSLRDSAQILQWVSLSDNYSKEDLDVIFKDDADEFLPPLLSLNKGFTEPSSVSSRDKYGYDGSKDSKKLECQSRLNLLVCVTQSGCICIYAFGIFSCLEYNIEQPSTSSSVSKFYSASLSTDYSLLTIVYSSSSGNLQMVTYNLPILSSHKLELHILAAKHLTLTSYFNYLSSTIRSITESWEEILMEIDAKLAKYAAEKTKGGGETVSDDFLELLMFGNPTKELEEFLLHDLSEKGLKKLGHSIELTYSNIQKLVLKHIQPVGLAIYYNLVDLCGMATCEDRFAQFGITPEKCENCLRAAGSFMLKATEVQQVIDYSMINFKAFFRWLYGAILRLSEETIPEELAKTSEQDVNIVAQFLKENFSLMPTGAKDERFCFNLERVGQYLKTENLTIVQNQKNNPWVQFLEANPALKNDPMLFPYEFEKSLVQQHETLHKEFEGTRQQVAQHCGKSLAPSYFLNLPTKQDAEITKLYHMFDSTRCHQMIYVVDAFPCDHLIFLHFPSTPASHTVSSSSLEFKSIQVFFEESNSCDQNRFYKIKDFQFYNEQVISVLLVKSGPTAVPILAQVPIKSLLERANCLDKLSSNLETIPKTNGWNSVANEGGTFYRLTGVLAHGHPPEEMDNVTNSSKDSSHSFSGLDCSERMEESDENKENFKET
ncbi:hypothetical protein CHUAL_004021 [Chamberlinius hualienensis]